jgi:NADPH-dependent glutamate synthase beta subunit-like oxidoreductase
LEVFSKAIVPILREEETDGEILAVSKNSWVVQFEKTSLDCYSEARDRRARNLLFHCWQQADSSPINPASE